MSKKVIVLGSGSIGKMPLQVALEEIKDLKAELERVKAQNKELLELNKAVGEFHEDEERGRIKAEAERDELKAENEKLKRGNKERQKVINSVHDKLHHIEEQNERLREFVRDVKDAEPAYWPQLRNQAQELLKEKE